LENGQNFAINCIHEFGRQKVSPCPVNLLSYFAG
jgi:hypothetical protein